MANSGWVTEMVDELCRIKREMIDAGDPLDFAAAWKQALWLHPPRGGVREVETADLFEAAQEAEPMVPFMRRACEDAWFDRRKKLRHLRVLVDSSGPSDAPFGPIVPRGRSRQAA